MSKLRYVLYLVMLSLGASTVFAFQSYEARVLGFVIVLVCLTLAWLLSYESLDYRLRSALVVAAFALPSIMGIVVVGLMPGPALGGAMAILLAALLRGRRAMLLILALFVIVCVALSAGLLTGTWDGPKAALESDLGSATVWLRITLMSSLLWAAIGWSTTFVVRSIERGVESRLKVIQEKSAALEQLNQEQEQRIEAEQSRRRAEQEALHSQKLEAVGHLSSGVAHDFNNALLVIQGWNELAETMDEPDERKKAHRAIAMASDQAAGLARQMLMLSRKDVRQPAYVALDKLAVATVKTMSRLLPADISLSVKTQSGCWVFADTTQLQQVLMNLLINARDALQGNGKIKVKVYQSEPAAPADTGHESGRLERSVILQVADDGPGIPEEIQKKVFEPFFTTKDVGVGTGLGLATVARIAEQSGGSVHLDSSRLKGTTLTIALPQVDAADIHEIEVASSSKGQESLAILVLEDDPLVRDLMVYALTRSNHRVSSFASGQQAIGAIESAETPFDLLCTDAVFPGASLREVIDRFISRMPEGQILVCSGSVLDAQNMEGFAPGSSHFLAKPFNVSQLLDAVPAFS